MYICADNAKADLDAGRVGSLQVGPRALVHEPAQHGQVAGLDGGGIQSVRRMKWAMERPKEPREKETGGEKQESPLPARRSAAG